MLKIVNSLLLFSTENTSVVSQVSRYSDVFREKAGTLDPAFWKHTLI